MKEQKRTSNSLGLSLSFLPSWLTRRLPAGRRVASMVVSVWPVVASS